MFCAGPDHSVLGVVANAGFDDVGDGAGYVVAGEFEHIDAVRVAGGGELRGRLRRDDAAALSGRIKTEGVKFGCRESTPFIVYLSCCSMSSPSNRMVWAISVICEAAATAATWSVSAPAELRCYVEQGV